ncbi:MAG: hypothetical protein J5658_01715 [Prevotella sp.]|nr:hypothetical protein [Prevotella sp.]
MIPYLIFPKIRCKSTTFFSYLQEKDAQKSETQPYWIITLPYWKITLPYLEITLPYWIRTIALIHMQKNKKKEEKGGKKQKIWPKKGKNYRF